MKISNRTAVVALALSFTGFPALHASTDLVPTGTINAMNNVVGKGEQATLTWNINYPDGSKYDPNTGTKEDLVVDVTAVGSSLQYDCGKKDLKTLSFMKMGNSGSFTEVFNNYFNYSGVALANPGYSPTPVNLGSKFGATYNNNIVPKFTKLGFGGQYRITSQVGSRQAVWSEKRTTDSGSKYIKTLFLGDPVPPELLSIVNKPDKFKSYLAPYIDTENGKIKGLNSTAMLVLMELDYVEGDVSSTNQDLKNFQDVVLLVHFVNIPK
jgi:hypothetical protein